MTVDLISFLMFKRYAKIQENLCSHCRFTPMLFIALAHSVSFSAVFNHHLIFHIKLHLRFTVYSLMALDIITSH